MNHPKLDFYRKQLDDLDQQLVSLLAERFKITDQVGEYKSKHGLSPMDSARENSQIERIRKLADEYALEAKVAQKVLRVGMDEVGKRHKAVQAKHK